MELYEFINKYLGKKVDYDGTFGAQCVDLFRQYCKDVWNVPHLGGVDGAKDIWLNYDNMPNEVKHMVKIQIPRAGDVVIWDKTPTNQYGHVAIVIFAYVDKLIVLEQNGFTQDGVKLVSRSYDNVLGYFAKR